MGQVKPKTRRIQKLCSRTPGAPRLQPKGQSAPALELVAGRADRAKTERTLPVLDVIQNGKSDDGVEDTQAKHNNITSRVMPCRRRQSIRCGQVRRKCGDRDRSHN